MCGIVGYLGGQDAAPIILDGLSRLEYRGYDSAGIAVISNAGELQLVKDVGRLSNLVTKLGNPLPQGNIGVGHTRWATHGQPNVTNAHPHVDTSGDVIVIHNGIVENHAALRLELMSRGCVFQSETDTEVVPHLIAHSLAEGLDFEEATRAAVSRLEGAAALLVLHRQQPDRIIAARIANAGGVVIGYGNGEMFLASDLPAIAHHTEQVAFLEDGELACVTPDGARYFTLDGTPVEKKISTLPSGAFVAAKGVYETYMEKEIIEQPESVLDTIRAAVQFEPPAINLPDLGLSDDDIRSLRRVVLIGMGTSGHAAMMGRAYMEHFAGLPAEKDDSSEFRYRRPVLDSGTLVIAIAQSGETVDTLAGMHEAKRLGAKVVAVCNTPGSQATRVGDGFVLMRCGPEVAVASTKTFIGSMAVLYLMACHIGHKRGHLNREQLATALNDLARMPQLIGEALKSADHIAQVAKSCQDDVDALFLGRHLELPIAMEGALKLKEISYIHAEGYASGEMKHGPIALIDEKMPVVAIALQDAHYAKMLNNIEEVRARNGKVIAIATAGDEAIAARAGHVIYVPDAPLYLQPMVSVVPVQLLAYHIARLKGRDIDMPRNLAKTVTVE